MKINSFAKAYIPSEHETQIYELWENSGAFKPHTDTSKPTFSVVMPPPNANGNLHAGHALNITIQDILTRYHRMKGDRTLWIPGADHAGIETQVVLEKKLEKEGRSRFQMTREQFYAEAWNFTQENKKNMEAQLRMLGASCDWSTERFTLDEEVLTQVYATFRQMYADGLIYRGERIVNYCVKYQTAYSDLEIVHEERVEPLYYLKYGELVVATVRPETQFGDVAIAVHPDDERYQQYIGKEMSVTLATGEIRNLPVIADTFVNPEFGTGAVKITPAHDPNDFEAAQRHNLPLIQAVNTQGKLTEIAGEFAGLKVAEARKQIAARLEEKGLIEKIDPNYRHSIALCYKSLTQIEPLVMPQWYIKVDSLKKEAIRAVEAGEVTYFPENFKKIQLDWLQGLWDWNISRQIWWGIPIKDALPEDELVGKDEDTFDTWFSSSQWPYVVLSALKERDFLGEFYPTTVLSTARDILFLWVTRMLMLGLYTQKAVPFQQVYLHGIVLDAQGKKMSKSKGNVVSPIELAAQYGTDAVRFGLVLGTSAAMDTPLPLEKIVGGRNFANKVWNVARFVMMQLGDRLPSQLPKQPVLTEADTEIRAKLAEASEQITAHLEAFRFALAAQTTHEFIWHQFADIYIEKAKLQKDETGQVSDDTCATLFLVLETSLRLLHPCMPFVSEAIWQQLPEFSSPLISANWPKTGE